MRARLTSLFGSRLVRNSASQIVGQSGRIVLQGAYFVIIARVLGADDFGAFAAVVAVVALITPFANVGAYNLMIRNIVREPEAAPEHYATAVSVTTIGSAIAIVLLLAARAFILPDAITWSILVAVAVADLFGARLVDVAGGVYVATERMTRTAAFPLILNATRLLGAVVLLLSPARFDLQSWSYVYLATSLLTSIPVALRVRAAVGRGAPNLRRFRGEWRQGILFSISLASQSVYNDIDKAMLARLSTLGATGIYTAAYRIIEMSFTPMRALLAAAYPRFFHHGTGGLRPTLAFARKLFVPALGYCVAASVGLLLFANLVPVILGSDYDQAVGALRGLAILPILRCLHYLPADTLTGAGFQGPRSVAQMGIAGVNVLLNIALIPGHGYQGAVVATLLSDGLLVVAMWTLIAVNLRRAPRAA